MLDDADLADLARTCARRFPRVDDQRIIAAEAGVVADHTDVGEAELAWTQLLTTARRDGKLGKLAAVLARSAPGDESLVAVAKALGDVVRPAAPRVPAAALAMAALGMLLVLGAGAAVFVYGGDEPMAIHHVQPLGTNVPPAAATAAALPPVPSGLDGMETVAEPASTPEPAATHPAPLAPELAPRASAMPENVPARSRTCQGAPGQVVGYWYAGNSSPGTVGQTITLARDARVRVDYPRAANGHNAAARELCVLSRGTQMTLSLAPIDASRGHWWVPVVGG